jgi:hypothetical protein
VAKDLQTAQTREARHEKSVGRAPAPIDATETAAQTHALLRARSGFNIKQLTAEYRALRASVLRLWMDDCAPDAPHLDDVIVQLNLPVRMNGAQLFQFFSKRDGRFTGSLGRPAPAAIARKPCT